MNVDNIVVWLYRDDKELRITGLVQASFSSLGLRLVFASRETARAAGFAVADAGDQPTVVLREVTSGGFIWFGERYTAVEVIYDSEEADVDS